MIILLENNNPQMALNHGENNSLAFFRNHHNMNVYLTPIKFRLPLIFTPRRRKLKGANWQPKLGKGRKLKGANCAPKIGGVKIKGSELVTGKGFI